MNLRDVQVEMKFHFLKKKKTPVQRQMCSGYPSWGYNIKPCALLKLIHTVEVLFVFGATATSGPGPPRSRGF